MLAERECCSGSVAHCQGMPLSLAEACRSLCLLRTPVARKRWEHRQACLLVSLSADGSVSSGGSQSA